ncbi:MAG: acylphosphatase, partial [Candidatus Thorarchaeota archaeon]
MYLIQNWIHVTHYRQWLSPLHRINIGSILISSRGLRSLKERATVNVTGIVQGVGFRPFVYRVALENSLSGYVLN